jgi:hypothetical protein
MDEAEANGDNTAREASKKIVRIADDVETKIKGGNSGLMIQYQCDANEGDCTVACRGGCHGLHAPRAKSLD